jgi:acetolactate synthase small subunit
MSQPLPQPQPDANTTVSTTLICLVQNKLGAMDRVLGLLTARGYIADRFAATITSPDRMQIMLTLSVEHEKALEKLVKVLYKQIYVIEIQMIMARDEELQGENIVNFPQARTAQPIDKVLAQ